eukprot:1179812-Prorocentrum_minimum.AAC.1
MTGIYSHSYTDPTAASLGRRNEAQTNLWSLTPFRLSRRGVVKPSYRANLSRRDLIKAFYHSREVSILPSIRRGVVRPPRSLRSAESADHGRRVPRLL